MISTAIRGKSAPSLLSSQTGIALPPEVLRVIFLGQLQILALQKLLGISMTPGLLERTARLCCELQRSETK